MGLLQPKTLRSDFSCIWSEPRNNWTVLSASCFAHFLHGFHYYGRRFLDGAFVGYGISCNGNFKKIVKKLNFRRFSEKQIFLNQNRLTRTLDFEWRTGDVITVVFYCYVIISGDKWSIADLVTFFHFRTIHGHLRRSVDRYCECTGTRIAGIYNEVWLLSCKINTILL